LFPEISKRNFLRSRRSAEQIVFLKLTFIASASPAVDLLCARIMFAQAELVRPHSILFPKLIERRLAS